MLHPYQQVLLKSACFWIHLEERHIGGFVRFYSSHKIQWSIIKHRSHSLKFMPGCNLAIVEEGCLLHQRDPGH
uniref:Uncharacterized protein n=2 Tax=Anguilla anguilla TaxID=7936 RepID=A0A0E9PPZ2_ANGAN